jgi:hypothetical protein
MNATISEVGTIVQAQQPQVLAHLDPGQLHGEAEYEDVTAAAGTVRATAQQLTGLGYATYARLRAQAVAEAFATSVAAELGFPAESNQASFVATVFSAWARQQPDWQAADSGQLEDQLGAIDIPFRLRRAEFVLQGINERFPGAGPSLQIQLATMKSATWDLITQLRALQRQVATDVHDQATALFGPQALSQESYLANPETFAATGPGGHGTELKQLYQACRDAVERASVTGSSQDLWEALTEGTKDWDRDTRAELLSRYVGFPVWDALIFPVVWLARLPQLTPVSVQRFSPLDATCLKAVDGDGKPKQDTSAKLDGTSIDHFGAFFKQAWRENDYLWGRLDGAELVMRLLSRQSEAAADLTRPLRSALEAILDTERDGLSHIGPVVQALTAQAGQITTMGPNGPA